MTYYQGKIGGLNLCNVLRVFYNYCSTNCCYHLSRCLLFHSQLFSEQTQLTEQRSYMSFDKKIKKNAWRYASHIDNSQHPCFSMWPLEVEGGCGFARCVLEGVPRCMQCKDRKSFLRKVYRSGKKLQHAVLFERFGPDNSGFEQVHQPRRGQNYQCTRLVA